MLSTRGRSPRVDELPPSSAPDTNPRRRGQFMALSIFTPARGSGNAAGAAAAHKAAAHPRRRGEERPHLRRRGDGVEALLRHRSSHAGSPYRQELPATLLLVSFIRYKVNNTTTNPRSEYPSPAIRPLHAPVPVPAPTRGCPHFGTQRQDAAGACAAQGRPRASPATARTSAEAARHAPGARTSPRRHSSVSHEPPRRQEGQGEDRRRRF